MNLYLDALHYNQESLILPVQPRFVFPSTSAALSFVKLLLVLYFLSPHIVIFNKASFNTQISRSCHLMLSARTI